MHRTATLPPGYKIIYKRVCSLQKFPATKFTVIPHKRSENIDLENPKTYTTHPTIQIKSQQVKKLCGTMGIKGESKWETDII